MQFTFLTFLRNSFHNVPLFVVTLGALLLPVLPVAAQNLFSPAIRVNDDAITVYELEQRTLFLTLLRAPGDPAELAREVLIEERLKRQALRNTEISVTSEQIDAGIEEFAARTELSGREFLQALAEGGVSRETVRDFVEMGLLWRDYASARFLAEARPTAAEIDRAMGAAPAGDIRVLLSEIIIPITPQTLEQAEALAQEISKTRGADAFAAAATKYSAAATRTKGGKMNWISLSELPGGLRPLFLSMLPGENTAPVPLPNAVAIFRLRAIQEAGARRARYTNIDYASYLIPGGRSPEALAKARTLRERVDSCDDLYGVAKGQAPEILERHSRAPGDIPRDVALELAKLDEGEVSTALTGNKGQTLVFLMLCGRTTSLTKDASRQDVAQRLTLQQLELLANAFLTRAQADATILER